MIRLGSHIDGILLTNLFSGGHHLAATSKQIQKGSIYQYASMTLQPRHRRECTKKKHRPCQKSGLEDNPLKIADSRGLFCVWGDGTNINTMPYLHIFTGTVRDAIIL